MCLKFQLASPREYVHTIHRRNSDVPRVGKHLWADHACRNVVLRECPCFFREFDALYRFRWNVRQHCANFFTGTSEFQLRDL